MCFLLGTRRPPLLGDTFQRARVMPEITAVVALCENALDELAGVPPLA
jgi:hypothetical protein